MTASAAFKIFIDFAMLSCFLLLFALPATGVLTHEVLGSFLFVLFLLHNALNYRWYKVLFKGRYGRERVLRSAVNAALLIMFLTSVLSGAAISRSLFKFIGGGGFALHKLHVCSAHWVLLFMAVHLGFHASMISSALKKLPRLAGFCLRLIFACFSVYGLKVFFAEEIFAKLAFYYTFSFNGIERGLTWFCLTYSALICFYAALGYAVLLLIAKTERKQL